MSMTPADEDLVSAVLAFWFEEGTVPGLCEFRPVWFASSPDLDRAVQERFRGAFERAEAGRLDHLEETARGALALVLLLDQFPRNLFRGQARAFASDHKAKVIAARAIARFDLRGVEPDLTALQRLFLYLPFQHSEDLADQRRSLALFQSLGADPMFAFIQDAARRKREVIARFGRFPHRNAVLGRSSTAEEVAFLESEEGRFWTA